MTAAAHGYLDANPVVDWFIGRLASSDVHVQDVHARVDGLLADTTLRLAISEFTIMEVHNTLLKKWREHDHPECDEDWFEASFMELMEHISDGKLHVVAASAHGVAHAMILAQLATQQFGHKFTTADSLHLVTAVRWAAEIEHRVRFYTSDKGIGRFLGGFPDFARFIDLVLLA